MYMLYIQCIVTLCLPLLYKCYACSLYRYIKQPCVPTIKRIQLYRLESVHVNVCVTRFYMYMYFYVYIHVYMYMYMWMCVL